MELLSITLRKRKNMRLCLSFALSYLLLDESWSIVFSVDDFYTITCNVSLFNIGYIKIRIYSPFSILYGMIGNWSTVYLRPNGVNIYRLPYSPQQWSKSILHIVRCIFISKRVFLNFRWMIGYSRRNSNFLLNEFHREL